LVVKQDFLRLVDSLAHETKLLLGTPLSSAGKDDAQSRLVSEQVACWNETEQTEDQRSDEKSCQLAAQLAVVRRHGRTLFTERVLESPVPQQREVDVRQAGNCGPA
jgi:hypothetical protein